MALHADHDLAPIVNAARLWRERCLLANGSVFSDKSLWTTENLKALDKFFIQNPIEGGTQGFLEKLTSQLSPAGPGAKQLCAEILWITRLFPMDIGESKKQSDIKTLWALSGESFPHSDSLLNPEVLAGVGHGGAGLLIHFWKELVYFIEALSAWKLLPAEDQRRISSDPWEFSDWLGSAPGGKARLLRHALSYLLFPNHFERIISRGHKLAIAKAFASEIDSSTASIDTLSPLEIDKAILSIRKRLEAKMPGQKLDFYWEPLRNRWKAPPDAREANVLIPNADRGPGTGIQSSLEAILAEYLDASTRTFKGNDPIRVPFETIKNELTPFSTSIARSLSVQWSVGKGKWALNPWIAVLDNRATITTQEGIYVVFAFRKDMTGVYLTLNQGVTNLYDKHGVKAKDILTERAKEVRTSCGQLLASGFLLDNQIDLRIDSGRGEKYQVSTIAHKFYEAGNVPSDTQIQEDVRQLLNAYINHITGKTKPMNTEKSVPLATIQAEFSKALSQAGLFFGKRHISLSRSFLASLATKRLAILTGLSGSGKTQIAVKFGEWLCPGTRTCIVPVRPDWTGPESVLGYEDALQTGLDGRRIWRVPLTLEHILQAVNAPNLPHLLILDEMNLAHVERYFADLLSGMESGKPCIPNLEKIQGSWYERAGSPRVAVPENLFIVGTVNVDETTYMFSPKVLDRANTIEFRVLTADLAGKGARPRSCTAAPDDFASSFLAIARDQEWHHGNSPAWISKFQDHLRSAHGILSQSGFEFGHRVYFEASRFAAIHAAADDPKLEPALDLQIMQKLLPRLHGSRRQLETTLIQLRSFCHGFEALNGKPEKELDPQTAKLPISFDKTDRMLTNLRANQFTSFTD